MIPWEQLASAPVPGGGELRLMRRGTEYSIMAHGGPSGAVELMNSRLSGSEAALADLAVAKLDGRVAPRVLIGGLGMGFTLRAALAALPADAQVVTAELVAAVAEWAREPMAHIFAGALADPRSRVWVGDVRLAMAEGPWDAILLDVDNGPGGLSRAANDGLYSTVGLAEAWRALQPGGVLAVWSSVGDEGFTRRLRGAGFAVEAVPVRARSGGKGARQVVWIAVR
ncbi:MAG: spermidine synthase [Caulobacterales bacterium]|nr:spermidine synthase [Caulobacterales bacterium]